MTTITDPEYRYKAIVNHVVDGDTLDVTVDLGFTITIKMRIRLYGVDTPEKGQPGYMGAKAFIMPLTNEQVLIKSHKPEDKYGRWLAEVFIDGKSVNDSLISSGFAKPYFGGTK